MSPSPAAISRGSAARRAFRRAWLPALLCTASLGLVSSGLAGAAIVTQTSDTGFDLPDLEELDADLRASLEQLYRAAQQTEREANTDRTSVARRWAELAASLGRYGFAPAARSAALRASNAEPLEARWVYLVGVLSREAGDLASAAESFERLLSDQRFGEMARLRLAGVLLERGEAEAARQLLSQSDAGPNVEAPQEAAGSVEPALEAERNALLGRAALALGEPRRAIAALRRALELQPDADALYYPLGLAHRELGEMEAARAALQRRGAGTVRLPDPALDELGATAASSAHDLVQRALAASAGGNLELAFDLYGRALEKQSEHLAALRGRAATAARLQRTDEAVLRTQELLELEPDNPGSHFNLATLLLRQKRTAEAEASLRRALELSPGYGEARYNLALVLGERGDRAGALEHFEQLANDPTQDDQALRADAAEQALRLLLEGSTPATLEISTRRRASTLALQIARSVLASRETRETAVPRDPSTSTSGIPSWQRAFAAADLIRQLSGAEAAKPAYEIVLRFDELPRELRDRLESAL